MFYLLEAFILSSNWSQYQQLYGMHLGRVEFSKFYIKLSILDDG